MIDKQIIQSEIDKIKGLRNIYVNCSVNPNSHEAIEAFHNWYEESCIVFNRYFDDKCQEYVKFSNIDNEGNGYSLHDNYQKIRKDFSILLDKLERCNFYMNSTLNVEQISQEQQVTKKKIFISHASKDKKLIDKFVDSIILLGMGIETETIAYTSREGTGVPLGDSIPLFIQDNIASADIVLLMLSDNYKNSEVCLNEMGAAWALKKHIVQILLPNTSFDKLGWLCSLNKAIKIDNAESMDSLYDVFTEKLNIAIKITEWNRNKKEFISSCRSYLSVNSPTIVKDQIIEISKGDVEDLGLLDYREKVEENLNIVSDICITMAVAVNKHTEMLNANTLKLQEVNLYFPNLSQTKRIIKSTAKGMDDLSTIFESNTPTLKTSFFDMVDNATKMKTLMIPDDVEIMDEEFDAINALLKSISEAKRGCIAFKQEIDKSPKVEQTINKSRKRLSNNLTEIIDTFNECITKGQELVTSIL